MPRPGTRVHTPTRSPPARLTGAALLNLCLGTLFTWSVFLAPIERELDASRAEVSAVFSWSLAVFAVAVVLAGRLVGRLRSDVVTLLTAGGTAGGMLLASGATDVTTLAIAYVGLVGTANGLGYLTAVDVGSTGFGRRRGLATGVVVAAYALGPLIAGPLAAALLPPLGWRRVLAGLGLTLGAVMLGAAALIGGGPQRAAIGSEAPRAPVRKGVPGIALLWTVFFTGALPGLFAFGHAASIAASSGGASRIGGLVVAGMAAGNTVGRAAAGALSDHVGRRPSLVATLACIVATCGTLSFADGRPVVLVGLILLGTTYGALSALMPAATADLVGPDRFGRTYGWVFTGWGVAGLLGPLLGAVLQDRTGAYLLPFLVTGLAASVGLLSTVVFGRRQLPS